MTNHRDTPGTSHRPVTSTGPGPAFRAALCALILVMVIAVILPPPAALADPTTISLSSADVPKPILDLSPQVAVADASSRAVAASTPPAGDPRDAAVRREVQALAGMLSDGMAELHEAGVTIRYAPPPGPGDPEAVGSMGAVALFSMESFGGGNNFHQFLAVFERGNREDLPPKSPFREWRLQGFAHVGERGTRAFDGIRIEKDRILLTGDSWDLSKDAMCCPSGAVKATFRFVPYSLTEIPMRAEDPPRPAQESAPRGGRLSPDGNPEGS